VERNSGNVKKVKELLMEEDFWGRRIHEYDYPSSDVPTVLTEAEVLEILVQFLEEGKE